MRFKPGDIIGRKYYTNVGECVGKPSLLIVSRVDFNAKLDAKMRCGRVKNAVYSMALDKDEVVWWVQDSDMHNYTKCAVSDADLVKMRLNAELTARAYELACKYRAST